MAGVRKPKKKQISQLHLIVIVSMLRTASHNKLYQRPKLVAMAIHSSHAIYGIQTCQNFNVTSNYNTETDIDPRLSAVNLNVCKILQLNAL